MNIYLKLSLIALFILGLCMVYWAGRKSMEVDTKNSNLEQLYKSELQKNRNLEKQITARDTLWSKIRKADSLRFLDALAKSNKAVIIYREKKSEPVKAYNSKELDSLIEILTR